MRVKSNSLIEHMAKCAKQVETWPKWKQDIIKQRMEENKRRHREAQDL